MWTMTIADDILAWMWEISQGSTHRWKDKSYRQSMANERRRRISPLRGLRPPWQTIQSQVVSPKHTNNPKWTHHVCMCMHVYTHVCVFVYQTIMIKEEVMSLRVGLGAWEELEMERKGWGWGWCKSSNYVINF